MTWRTGAPTDVRDSAQDSRQGSRRPGTVSTRAVVVAGLLVALFLAGVVSFYASRHPDGLSYVAQKLGLASQHRHPASGSPFAGYTTKGVSDRRLSSGVAGVVGVLLVASLGSALALFLRRRGEHVDRADRS
ncbi:PDGLE domain-containing protein [Pedococcus sp. 5OH_020]|uniref:PDGLE domain-containing protein n=1 Tax=Pedococcus sp. 5OH_020 TaxID=2989814 RepID=UPI0022EA057E|nr:PDGLE domain-containing protein [Pedococcus sp. 5OH_020]